MASTTTLVFVSMLLCLSCCMSIRGPDLSKHLVVDNDYKVGFTGGPLGIESAEDLSSDGSTKETIYTAGYRSRGLLGGTFWHGVRANLTVWKVYDVQPRSSSGAYIAVVNKEGEGIEVIGAGYHVNPRLYNDTKVHFFTYWELNGWAHTGHGSVPYGIALSTQSTHGNTTGCYNELCEGYKESEVADLYPGGRFGAPLSIYDGKQRTLTIMIKKDEQSGDWSLYREDHDRLVLLGWWPKKLFKYLSEKAEIIQWVGFVSHDSNERSPSMGSGHFPTELEGKAAWFSDCFGLDESGEVYEDNYDPVKYYIDRPDCYNVSEWYVSDEQEARRHFFYGGPGGCSLPK